MHKVPNAKTIKAMEDARNSNIIYDKNLQELKIEIAKGLEGGVSERTVKDIINDKLKAGKG